MQRRFIVITDEVSPLHTKNLDKLVGAVQTELNSLKYQLQNFPLIAFGEGHRKFSVSFVISALVFRRISVMKNKSS